MSTVEIGKWECVDAKATRPRLTSMYQLRQDRQPLRLVSRGICRCGSRSPRGVGSSRRFWPRFPGPSQLAVRNDAKTPFLFNAMHVAGRFESDRDRRFWLSARALVLNSGSLKTFGYPRHAPFVNGERRSHQLNAAGMCYVPYKSWSTRSSIRCLSTCAI
jgi:hypothetical protein